MRGLTSHARQIHGLDKNQLKESLDENDNGFFRIIGGIGVFILSILAIGKLK
jgi:hypothetical protein